MSDTFKLHAQRLIIRQRSEAISSAGIGLCALAEILGADGSEHDLSDALKERLAQAVYAIGAMIRENGNYLIDLTGEAGEQ